MKRIVIIDRNVVGTSLNVRYLQSVPTFIQVILTIVIIKEINPKTNGVNPLRLITDIVKIIHSQIVKRDMMKVKSLIIF